MKRHFLLLLSTIFAIAAISLVIIQISQTKKSVKISENLFNISVNNAIDQVFAQMDQMKVEDYVSQTERYRLQRYRRIDDMNEKMQDIIRQNDELFYDESRVLFGISTQDSVFVTPGSNLSPAEENVLSQYNTLLNARNRLIGSIKSNVSLDIDHAIDASKLNFPLLDSLIREELIINGVDITPSIGVLLADADSLLYTATTLILPTYSTRPTNTRFTLMASPTTKTSLWHSLSHLPQCFSAETQTYTPLLVCV